MAKPKPNLAAFNKIALNIGKIIKTEKMPLVENAFVAEGREMLQDFRTRQGNAKEEEATRAYMEAQRKVDRSKAQAFAAKHAGGPRKYKRGDVWINRSHFARRGVHSYVEKNENSIAVGMYHTAPYGAYLEFAHNRKYAIIEPIVRSHMQS